MLISVPAVCLSAQSLRFSFYNGSPTDVDSTVPLGLCGAMVGYKVESRADETTN